MTGECLSAGGHTSSLPCGLHLPKGAPSSVLFWHSIPADLRVLVKRTHIKCPLLLPRSYDVRCCLPTLPVCCLEKTDKGSGLPHHRNRRGGDLVHGFGRRTQPGAYCWSSPTAQQVGATDQGVSQQGLPTG